MSQSKDPASALAARYKSWQTEELVRAATVEAREYTPEAINLIRSELKQRGLTLDEQNDLEAEVAAKHQRSYVGVNGWLLFFVVVFALNFVTVLAGSVVALSRPLPISITSVIVLEGLVGAYALITAWRLVSRHPTAPWHAQAVLVAFCLLELASWFYFTRLGMTQQPFPLTVVTFTCIWSSYLSYSKRVRSTYVPRGEAVTESSSTR